MAPTNKNPLKPVEERSIGVVYIINRFKVKHADQPFHCVMIYQDNDSGFCFIKPLLAKLDTEIALELFKIFTTYGAPEEVHINSCTQVMVQSIQDIIKQLCPMFKIDFIKENAETIDIAMLVVTKLHEWMTATKKDQWEIGCCIVQRNINTKITNGKVPQDLFFNNRDQESQIEDSDFKLEEPIRFQEIKIEPSTSKVSKAFNNPSKTPEEVQEPSRRSRTTKPDKMDLCYSPLLSKGNAYESIDTSVHKDVIESRRSLSSKIIKLEPELSDENTTESNTLSEEVIVSSRSRISKAIKMESSLSDDDTNDSVHSYSQYKLTKDRSRIEAIKLKDNVNTTVEVKFERLDSDDEIH